MEINGKRARSEVDSIEPEDAKRHDTKSVKNTMFMSEVVQQFMDLFKMIFVTDDASASAGVAEEVVQPVSLDEVTLPDTSTPWEFNPARFEDGCPPPSEEFDVKSSSEGGEGVNIQTHLNEESASSSNEEEEEEKHYDSVKDVPLKAYLARRPPPETLSSLGKLYKMMDECAQKRHEPSIPLWQLPQPRRTRQSKALYMCRPDPVTGEFVPTLVVDPVDHPEEVTVFLNPTNSLLDDDASDSEPAPNEPDQRLVMIDAAPYTVEVDFDQLPMVTVESIIGSIVLTPMNVNDGVWERSPEDGPVQMVKFINRPPMNKAVLLNLIDIAVMSVSFCAGPNTLKVTMDVVEAVSRGAVDVLGKYAIARILGATHHPLYFALVVNYVATLITLFVKSSAKYVRYLNTFKDDVDKHAQRIAREWDSKLDTLLDDHHAFDDYSMYLEIESAGKEILTARRLVISQLENYDAVIQNCLVRE